MRDSEMLPGRLPEERSLQNGSLTDLKYKYQVLLGKPQEGQTIISNILRIRYYTYRHLHYLLLPLNELTLHK